MTKLPLFQSAIIAAAMLAAPAANAQETTETTTEAHTAAYSVATTRVSVLLDDPEAAAILERLIPAVYANDLFQTMGRSQTLTAIQQYEPASLTDAKLAEIQAEFDKLAESHSHEGCVEDAAFGGWEKRDVAARASLVSSCAGVTEKWACRCRHLSQQRHATFKKYSHMR